MSLRSLIVGTWRLASYTEHPEGGGEASYPLGQDAAGLLMYTHDGFVSAQLMRRGRPAFASGDWFRATDAERQAASGYIGYAGRYAINEASGVLTHGMDVSFFPNWIGQTQVRRADCDGTTLWLTTAGSIRSGGWMVTPNLAWMRA